MQIWVTISCWIVCAFDYLVDLDILSIDCMPLIANLLFWSQQVAAYEDPREACSAIAAESYKLWLEHENRTDDITIIIVHIRDSENVGAQHSNFFRHKTTLLIGLQRFIVLS